MYYKLNLYIISVVLGTSLCYAMFGQPKIEKFCANNLGKSVLHQAVNSQDVFLVRAILKTEPGDIDQPDLGGHTPLCDAIIQGNDEIVVDLLEAGAAVEQITFLGHNALHLAVFLDRVGLVKLLLDYINDTGLNSKNGMGHTPLHLAIFNRNQDILRLLVQRGASPFIKDNSEMSGLQWAITFKNSEILEALQNGKAKL
jgi:ankyrin repeat protein